MTDVSEFFDKLYRLLQQEQLWGPLAVVLPTIGVVSFLAGRYFPRHTIIVAPNSPADPPRPDPRMGELERKVRALEGELTSARAANGELRQQLVTASAKINELGQLLAAAQSEAEVAVAQLTAAQVEIRDLCEQLAAVRARLDNARTGVSPTGPGIWLATDPCPPNDYAQRLRTSIPIYVVANFKGGVGKTTVATGLAAHFANPFRDPSRACERVLLIDLDFQGSLSSMALTTSDRIPAEGETSRASRLISGSADSAALAHMRQRVKDLDKLPGGQAVEFYAVPAYYDLAQAENRLMVEWLIGDSKSDIRYHLADILLSAEVQARYDRVVIDAPPRLTTAHVQALTASTHVLIPTVLDQLSGEAVGSFVDQLVINAKLWPHLKVLGVVGSMTELGQDKPLRDYENEGLLAIVAALEQNRDAHMLPATVTTPLPRSCFIPDLTDLGRAAGSRIGYLNPLAAGAPIRRVFDVLGAQVTDAARRAVELGVLVRS